MTLKSRVDFQQLRNTMLNDIWGYVDQTGVEYALVGAREGVSVVSLADPENPVEVYWHQGDHSVWRDLKTYGNYAYVTTEAQSGLLIIDLSPLPNGSITTEVYYQGSQNATWKSAHNLYIDENGFCYIFGANRGNGGVIILDIATDPLNPIEVGVFDTWYVHDGYARGNILYLAHIYQGTLSMVDISDKSNPVLLGTALSPSNFTHNIWPSDDNNYVFTTDEVSGAFLTAFNVSDPTNIVEVGKIQSSPGLGIVPHNVHIKENWMITSYYTDGVTIHDVSNPHNMIEVANYDTSPLQNKNTQGCWGAYPFLPSGLVLGTDMEEGLFVLQPNYKLGSYLEGTVSDASNNNPLNAAQVKILAGNQTAQTNFSGNYATGIVGTGNFEVEFSRSLYYPQTHTLSLNEGQHTTFNVSLEPIPSFPCTVIVLDEATNSPIFDAKVRLEVPLHTSNQSSNGLGEAEFNLYYDASYILTAGKWGYNTKCIDVELNEQNNVVTIKLSKGYFDDFSFDFGWTTTSTAESGQWVREIPIGTTINSNPSVDAPYDCGGYAYMTGNGSVNYNFDQVVNGVVTLISPVFDLTDFTDPHVNYWYWYYNSLGANPTPNDTLNISLSNGIETIRIEHKFYPDNHPTEWGFSSIRVLDFITPTENMQLFVQISDFADSPNIAEAAFDYFRITNSNTVNIEISEQRDILAYPNPSQGIFQLSGIDNEDVLTLHDSSGRVVRFTRNETTLDLIHLDSGVYILSVLMKTGQQKVLRILVNK